MPLARGYIIHSYTVYITRRGSMLKLKAGEEVVVGVSVEESTFCRNSVIWHAFG